MLPCLLLWSCAALGQSKVSAGLLPEVSVSYRWQGKWRLTGQVQSMQQFLGKERLEVLRGNYDYIRTDFTTALSYKLNPDWTLGTAYMLRLQEGRSVQRSIQQISSATQQTGVRLGHRFRTDQTFNRAEDPQFRVRYRFSVELPLDGLTINDREWYFITSTEVLTSIQSGNCVNQCRSVSLGFM